jgi:hypothetical protein
MATTDTIVYLEWVDAVASSGWQIKGTGALAKCKSVGFLTYENNDEVHLAAAIGENDCNAVMIIPKSWISNWTEIDIEAFKRKKQRKTTAKVGGAKAKRYFQPKRT